jgi:hypothetical protein
MPFVLQQDLRGLLDPFVIETAFGHVLQDGDIGYYLLGVVILTGDGHCQPPCPRTAGQNSTNFVQ